MRYPLSRAKSATARSSIQPLALLHLPRLPRSPPRGSRSGVEQEGRLGLEMLASNLMTLYWEIYYQHQVQSQMGKLKTGGEGAGDRSRPRGMTAGKALRLGEMSRLGNQVNTGPNPDLTKILCDLGHSLPHWASVSPSVIPWEVGTSTMCQMLVNRPVQDLLSNPQQPWEADITIPILQRGKLKPRCARAPKLGHFPNHSMSVLLASAPSIPAPEYQLAVRPWDCPFPSLSLSFPSYEMGPFYSQMLFWTGRVGAEG